MQPIVVFRVLVGDEVSGQKFTLSCDEIILSESGQILETSNTLTLDDVLDGAGPEFVVLAQGDVQLSNDGLLAAVREMQADEATSLMYGNALELPNKTIKNRSEFDIWRLANQDYLGAVILIRSKSFRETHKEWAHGLELAIWSITAEFVKAGLAVRYFPEEFYSTNKTKKLLTDSQRSVAREISARLLKHQGGGTVESITEDGIVRVRRTVKNEPKISIVIPTQGTYTEENGKQTSFLLRAISSIVEISTYENYEVVLVIDEGYSVPLLEKIEKILKGKISILIWDKEFNFSEKMNAGVLEAQGDYVLLLNDDVEVLTPDWLESMLGLAQDPLVGMVGSMLYYDDDTIQHAGHAYFQGSPTHLGLGLPRGTRGPESSLLVERRVSGVTAACALMRKEIFCEAGGFSTLLPGNFNDVDLCMKVGRLGYALLWTPLAELYHYESKSRDARVRYFELDLIQKRWRSNLHDSRFWPEHPHSGG